jgi:hypothetical protein
MTKKKSVAVEVAAEQTKESEDGIVMLSTGVRARIIPVASPLIDEINSRIPDPPVPVQVIDGQEHANPMHPEYRQKMAEASAKRTTAVLDAFVLFGVELVDGVPEDDEWVKKIKFMEKRGVIDLSCYNLKDPMHREFVYKRFIAVSSKDTRLIGVASGVLSEDIDRAMESFRGDETREPDLETVDKE